MRRTPNRTPLLKNSYCAAVASCRACCAALCSAQVPAVLEEEGDRYFGNLPRSMMSLFMSIAGGVSWEEAFRPLLHVSTIWAMCFIFYICFSDAKHFYKGFPDMCGLGSWFTKRQHTTSSNMIKYEA